MKKTPFKKGFTAVVKFADLANGKLPSPITIHDYFVVTTGNTFGLVTINAGDTLVAKRTTKDETVFDDFWMNRAGSSFATNHTGLPDLATSGHPADIIATDTASFNNNLSALDIDVQTALETIDELAEGHNYTADRFVATAAQTAFVLTTTPADNSLIEFFINGVKYYNGFDYSIVGDTITWLDVDFVIEVGMIINVKYTQ